MVAWHGTRTPTATPVRQRASTFACAQNARARDVFWTWDIEGGRKRKKAERSVEDGFAFVFARHLACSFGCGVRV